MATRKIKTSRGTELTLACDIFGANITATGTIGTIENCSWQTQRAHDNGEDVTGLFGKMRIDGQYRQIGFAISREDYDQLIEAAQTQLQSNVPGLADLEAALNAESKYHEAFGKMMEEESNDGARPPTRPTVSSADVAAQYPVAAAYLKARGFRLSNNVGKYSAGDKAMEKIANGENHEEAIAEMEREWTEYCNQRVWD